MSFQSFQMMSAKQNVLLNVESGAQVSKRGNKRVKLTFWLESWENVSSKGPLCN